jgi:hypothetical protein
MWGGGQGSEDGGRGWGRRGREGGWEVREHRHGGGGSGGGQLVGGGSEEGAAVSQDRRGGRKREALGETGRLLE